MVELGFGLVKGRAVCWRRDGVAYELAGSEQFGHVRFEIVDGDIVPVGGRESLEGFV